MGIALISSEIGLANDAGKIVTVASTETISDYNEILIKTDNLSNYRFMTLSVFVNATLVNPVIIPIGFNNVQSRFTDDGVDRFVMLQNTDVSKNEITISTQNSGYWIGLIK